MRCSFASVLSQPKRLRSEEKLKSSAFLHFCETRASERAGILCPRQEGPETWAAEGVSRMPLARRNVLEETSGWRQIMLKGAFAGQWAAQSDLAEPCAWL